MATQAQTTRQQPRQQQTPQVPATIAPRIPYWPEAETKFGIDEPSWHALTDAIWPAAKTVEGVMLALSYCKARNLDPFKRPVHIVPIWSKEKRRYVESVWPGINELRTTATRTNAYAGRDECEFGPDIADMKFAGAFENEDGTTRKSEVTITFPEWARYRVYRIVQGQRVEFEGPKVYWLETYATIGRTDLPNEMWQNRPRGQLDKCAEAAALRAAFPEEIGAEYIADEMAHASMRSMRDITPTKTETAPTAAKPTREQFSDAMFDLVDADGQVTPMGARAYVEQLTKMLVTAATAGDDFVKLWETNLDTAIGKLPGSAQAQLQKTFDKLWDEAEKKKKQPAAAAAETTTETKAAETTENTGVAGDTQPSTANPAGAESEPDNREPSEGNSAPASGSNGGGEEAPRDLVTLNVSAKPESKKRWLADMIPAVKAAPVNDVIGWWKGCEALIAQCEKIDMQGVTALRRAVDDRIAS